MSAREKGHTGVFIIGNMFQECLISSTSYNLRGPLGSKGQGHRMVSTDII